MMRRGISTLVPVSPPWRQSETIIALSEAVAGGSHGRTDLVRPQQRARR